MSPVAEALASFGKVSVALERDAAIIGGLARGLHEASPGAFDIASKALRQERRVLEACARSQVEVVEALERLFDETHPTVRAALSRAASRALTRYAVRLRRAMLAVPRAEGTAAFALRKAAKAVAS